jgi:cob(I)alamin adenosyltransferase
MLYCGIPKSTILSYLLPRSVFPRAGTWSRLFRASFPAEMSTCCTTTTKQTDASPAPVADVLADIEDLHNRALLRGSTTYIDPATGFTVFTNKIHLERGTCCGNQCRHCPYGWANVAVVADETKRPTAKAPSGDKDAVKAVLADIERKHQEYRATHDSDDDEDDDDDDASNSGYSDGSQSTGNADPDAHANIGKVSINNRSRKNKTGGRHGGRLTKKNVPYTRGGDSGTSQLLTGERRSKADLSFEAMGTVDELCSVTGVVYAELIREIGETSNTLEEHDCEALKEWLLEIMSRLFDIGSHLAKPKRQRREDDSSSEEDDEPKFVADGIGGGFDVLHIQQLEDWIDTMTEDLPELRSFILPTGTPTAAQFHVARTVCRRAERMMVPLVQNGIADPNAMKYVNRLSDFFFAAARWVSHQQGMEEIQYRRATRGAKQRGRVNVSLEKLSLEKKPS